MDQINGFMYGNMPGLEVCVGERIAWYVFGLSAEHHYFAITGQTVLFRDHR